MPPNQPADTIITGIKSVGNRTFTPLSADGIFEGTFEDVSNAASISIIIKSDKDSAPQGFIFQWSADGTEVDFEEKTVLGAAAGLSGRAFSITPKGDFFRIKYINGPQAQTKFRLAVTYHSAGTGLISRLLNLALTDNQFAQTVRAVLTAKKPNGEYVNLSATEDGKLIVKLDQNP